MPRIDPELKTKQFVNKSKKLNDDKYDYSKVHVFSNIKEKVTIICKKHGPFEQTVKSHLNKNSQCPKCNRENSLMSFDEFEQKAMFKHKNKYKYHENFHGGNHEKIKITCKLHGDFWQTRNSHLLGRGCKKCGILKLQEASRDTLEGFIEKAVKIHGDRYDYSRIRSYSKNSIKLPIVCKDHGIFMMSANSHLSQRQNCPRCAKEKCRQNLILDVEILKQRLNGLHDNFYQYHYNTYQAMTKKMKITCPLHGDFWQIPSNHLRGETCKLCANKRIADSKFKGFDYFLTKSKEQHGDKYDYSESEYIGSHSKIKIICPKHGPFEIVAKSHMLYGFGCRRCSDSKTITKCDQWLNYLKIPNNKREVYAKLIKSNKNYYFDAYDPDTNTVYEFHGNYFHGNPRIYDSDSLNKLIGKTYGELHQSTIERENNIKAEGYKLVVIWEDDWDKLKKDIIDSSNSSIPSSSE